MAVAALVSGIVGLVTCFLGVASVLGAVFGFIGAHQVKRSGGWLTGLGLARAGWITGIVGTALAVAFWGVAASEGAFDDLPGRGMQVGTCIDLDDQLTGDGSPAPTVSCDDIHDAEVYEIGWLNPRRDQPFPGERDVHEAALAMCSGEPFTDYVGVASEASALRVDVLLALGDRWSEWRGEYVCLARASEGPLTATVHRSGR